METDTDLHRETATGTQGDSDRDTGRQGHRETGRQGHRETDLHRETATGTLLGVGPAQGDSDRDTGRQGHRQPCRGIGRQAQFADGSGHANPHVESLAIHHTCLGAKLWVMHRLPVAASLAAHNFSPQAGVPIYGMT